MLPEIVPGVITQWSGSLVSIPAGWALCDGNNGTPDLTDKFIVGAGDTYNPGNTGGATTHTHVFGDPIHDHILELDGDILSGAEITKRMTNNLASGTTDAGSTLAPYYSLAYIMKL